MVSRAFQIPFNYVTPGPINTWPRFSFSAAAEPGSAGGQAGKLPLPQAHQVHIWAACLDLPAPARAAHQSALSADELERASRFHFEVHRNRYINAHGMLRQLLSSYLGLSAASLDFSCGTNGKPALSGKAESSGLQFNLSHSEDLALIAVAHKTPVGIDLERIRPLDDAEELVARFFSPREASRYRLVADPEKTEAFFNLWTRKEAWLKATGQGIAHLLDQVEVSFRPGEPARLLKLPKGFPDLSFWSLCGLRPAIGFAAACVLAAPGAEPECRCWEGQFPQEI